MIEIINLSDIAPSQNQKLSQILHRASGLDEQIVTQTQTILQNVRNRGDEALLEYTARFDQVSLTPQTLQVPPGVITELAAQVDQHVMGALREAIANIRHYHNHQLAQSWEIERQNGVRLGQRVRPLSIVGLYVPGGKAAYPSTLMMNAIPAQVAGVNRLVVVTPPAQFHQTPVISAVLKELNLFEVYLVGGAQSIAALAYGTATIPRVDKIVGPGNQYVAAAKKLVYGSVDIDSIAGPSEIVVIADDTAKANFIAADLLSQAEHSEDAAALLLTTSQTLAAAVQAEINVQIASLPRRAIIEKSLADFGAVIVVESLEIACELANRLAPEHIEVMTAHNDEVAESLHHAGAIFIGDYSAETVGDYFAGTNHVLPTSGTARFSSALGVYDFLKRTSIIRYTREELNRTAKSIEAIAQAEGLEAHARAATIRISTP